MRRISALIIVLATLAGCATASPTYLSNGRQGLSIDCSGEAMSWQKCYAKAQASCPTGHYQIVGTDGALTPPPDQTTLGVDLGNFQNRVLTVVCTAD